jgi:hypothetical protein
MRATCPVHTLFLTLLNLLALVEEWTLQISLRLESSRVHLQDRRTVFYPEDGGSKILGKVGVFLTEYTSSHSRRRQFSYHPKTSNFAYNALHDSIFSINSLIQTLSNALNVTYVRCKVWPGFRRRLAWQISTKSSGELAGFNFRT